MSGIFFVYDENLNANSNYKYLESSKLISHRGNEKLLVEKNNLWTIFFYRLKTESSQIQPYINDEITILIDGEIYNAKELAKNFGLSTNNPKNVNELIHNIYKKYGTRLFEKLNGMFTILIVDKSKKQIICVKDKLGLKPGFYYKNSDKFIFSSEAKSIINCCDDTSINYQNSLASIFLCGRPPYEKTHFNNIYDIEQSRYIIFDYNTKKITKKKYFCLSSWIDSEKYSQNKKKKHKFLINHFVEKFEDTIDRHLTGNSSFGSLFSAGLDSSLFARMMSKKLSQNINLYYFESEIHNYEKYYKNFIMNNKFKLNKLKMDDRHYLVDMPLMVYHYECTAKEEASPISLLAERAKSNNDTVLICGDGDTILGGSRCHASYFSRSFLYENLLSKNLIKLLNRLFNDFLHAGVSPDKIDYLYFPSFFSSSEVFTNIMLHKGERLNEWNKRIDLYNFLENKLERETQSFILDDTFYRFQRYMIRQERASSRFGIQFRYPYLDDEIIKMSVNMPLHLKQKFNIFQKGERFGLITEGKSIMRDVAKKLGLNEEIINRREVGSNFNDKYYKIIIDKFGLKYLSEFLRVNENNLKNVALNSFDQNLSRVQYSFIANELLLRIFDEKQDPYELKEKFYKILFN